MKNLQRRLLPLYITAALQGAVLWYSIEKLFMTSIGFDAQSIGLMAGVIGMTTFFLEIPSGILADRWSRKGVLIISSIALALTSLVGGLSYGIPVYYIAGVLWGVFFAFQSGLFESMIYDTILEEKHSVDNGLFEKLYGRTRILYSLALLCASLVNGFVASNLGLRHSFFISIPFAILSIVPLLFFKEPTMHQKSTETHLLKHIKLTFSQVFKNPILYHVVAAMVIALLMSRIAFEFNQLWFIALAVPVFWYGPANAVVQQCIGVSGLLSDKINNSKKSIIILAFIMLGSALLLFIHSAFVIVIAQFSILTSIFVLYIFLTKILNDSLTSEVRAGASSAVSSIGNALFLPAGILFGWIAKNFSVFQATWLVVALALIVLANIYKIEYKSQNLKNTVK